MELFLYVDLVFSDVETLHLCCDTGRGNGEPLILFCEIGRGNWLGRVLKIMCSNGVVCMLVWSLAMMKLCTCAVILEGAMENH